MSRANASFYWPKLLALLLYYFTFLFFLSVGWYCGPGVFVLIGCQSLSLSFALPTLSIINIEGSVTYKLTQFLSNRSQYVMVDGCQSTLVNNCIRSEAGQYFGPVIVPPVHLGACFKTGE